MSSIAASFNWVALVWTFFVGRSMIYCAQSVTPFPHPAFVSYMQLRSPDLAISRYFAALLALLIVWVDVCLSVLRASWLGGRLWVHSRGGATGGGMKTEVAMR